MFCTYGSFSFDLNRGFGYRINLITGVEDFEVKDDYMFASKRVVSC